MPGPFIKPGEPGYEKQVAFMRADLESDMSLSKLIKATREYFKSEGRDFDKEFDEYRRKGVIPK
jgi:hypothetical protein